MTLKNNNSLVEKCLSVINAFKFHHSKELFYCWWDFRQNKPQKDKIYLVDEAINDMCRNVDKINKSDYYLFYEKSDKTTRFSNILIADNSKPRFWIANKYYGWYCSMIINDEKMELGLTFNQIERLDILLQKVD